MQSARNLSNIDTWKEVVFSLFALRVPNNGLLAIFWYKWHSTRLTIIIYFIMGHLDSNFVFKSPSEQNPWILGINISHTLGQLWWFDIFLKPCESCFWVSYMFDISLGYFFPRNWGHIRVLVGGPLSGCVSEGALGWCEAELLWRCWLPQMKFDNMNQNKSLNQSEPF
jgi:hypothetical protein